MRNDLVSIIIPYFRNRDFFAQTIKSVNEQTYQNKEIIVIYDDNDHEDLSFVREIIKKNKKSRLIINKKNLGVGKSRNKGIIKSKGQYIAFLDSDDFWSKNKLKYQINFMKKNNLSATFTAYNIVNENNKKIGIRKAKKIIFFKDLLYSCDIGLSTVVLKKSILNKKQLFPDLKTKEDYVLWLLLSKRNIIFYGIRKKLSSWRKTDNSLSSNIPQKIVDGFRVYKNHMNYSTYKSIKYLLLLSFNYLKKSNFF